MRTDLKILHTYFTELVKKKTSIHNITSEVCHAEWIHLYTFVKLRYVVRSLEFYKAECVSCHQALQAGLSGYF